VDVAGDTAVSVRSGHQKVEPPPHREWQTVRSEPDRRLVPARVEIWHYREIGEKGRVTRNIRNMQRLSSWPSTMAIKKAPMNWG